MPDMMGFQQGAATSGLHHYRPLCSGARGPEWTAGKQTGHEWEGPAGDDAGLECGVEEGKDSQAWEEDRMWGLLSGLGDGSLCTY